MDVEMVGAWLVVVNGVMTLVGAIWKGGEKAIAVLVTLEEDVLMVVLLVLMGVVSVAGMAASVGEALCLVGSEYEWVIPLWLVLMMFFGCCFGITVAAGGIWSAGGDGGEAGGETF